MSLQKLLWVLQILIVVIVVAVVTAVTVAMTTVTTTTATVTNMVSVTIFVHAILKQSEERSYLRLVSNSERLVIER